ncbi:biopolymer transporter ExbD [Bacteroidia bacterium]|nr:biopolymer transporter ExbD [Bacteroidia bacterium]
MSKFRQFTTREVPSLNTASLPDLVFSTLFFFMILTTMRTVSLQTQFDIPAVTELQKLEEKSHITYVMVGYKPGSSDTSGMLIQLNSDLITLDEIPARLENSDSQIAVLKIDKNIPVGLVQDIKQQLRQAGILTIHYSARKSPKNLLNFKN